jgi:hypothetical protein
MHVINLPLECAEPHPDIPVGQRIFAPLIGSWDLVVTWYQNGVQVRQEAGEWHFAWVLEGRAIQDVWIVPPRKLRAQSAHLYEYGTSLRFYDAELSAWQSTWIGPMHRVVHTFIARGDENGITMETTAAATKSLRWVFSQIKTESFRWENFEESDDGDWILVQDFAATRAVEEN